MAEDYVELISDLIAETGEARLTDLARNMGVTHATVAKVIQRLQLGGLVESRPYRSIFLTEEGQTLAMRSRERHRAVHDFLLALGVSQMTAEADAEGMEHHVSAETMARIVDLTSRLAAGRVASEITSGRDR